MEPGLETYPHLEPQYVNRHLSPLRVLCGGPFVV